MTKKSAPIWFAFYIEDWLNGTDDLSAEESGVYLRLIARMYQRNGFLRDDDRRNAMDCNLSTRRFRTIKNRLMEDGKLTVEDGLLTNLRVQEELKKRAKISEKKSQNAKSKSSKPSENPAENYQTGEANAQHMHSYTRAYSHRLTEDTQNIQQTQSPTSSQKNTERQSARDSLFEDLPIDDCGRMGFCGEIVRLKPSDVEGMRKSYPTIPDVLAAIRKFDAAMVERRRRGKHTDGWKRWLEENLCDEHANRLERRKPEENVETYFDHETGKRQRVNRG